jgi:FkbM family methyltransferase
MSFAEIVKRIPGVRPVGRRIKRLLQLSDATQAGEYRVLRRVLRPDDPRFLVDVGAHDGVSLSNSRPFLQSGWTGILLEPSPEPFRKLAALYADNDRVTCLNIAASNTQGAQNFYFGTDGAGGFMGTICTDRNAWFDKARSDRAIKVTVDRLTNVLVSNDCLADFGLLLIDTEGMDYECLLGLDFDKFRPRVIITEEYEPKNAVKFELLEQRGYRLVKRIGCNTIWRTAE